MMRGFILIFYFFTLISCKERYQINDKFSFHYRGDFGHDQSNIYFEDLGVLSTGCDSAKWNDELIVTKGNSWRCSDSEDCYHIINIQSYTFDPRQEESSAVWGPYTNYIFDSIDPLKEMPFLGLK